MARPMLPLNALRAFESAARHLNFSRAADELSVTPGAVSQQIRILEDTVGAPLFRREARGWSLPMRRVRPSRCCVRGSSG